MSLSTAFDKGTRSARRTYISLHWNQSLPAWGLESPQAHLTRPPESRAASNSQRLSKRKATSNATWRSRMYAVEAR
eukprot:7664933-Lingulodinium_polyedra.AAC.1